MKEGQNSKEKKNIKLKDISTHFWVAAREHFNNETKTAVLKKRHITSPFKFIKLKDEIIAVHTKTLGEGAFGKIKKGIRQDGQKIIIKRVDKSSSNSSQIDREINIAKRLGHYVGDIEHNGKAFMAMKFYKGKNLKQVLKDDLTVNQKLIIAINCCEQIKRIHQLKVLHRDIKPENFIVDIKGNNIDVHVIDFGLSRMLPIDTKGPLKVKSDVVGTPGYMPPELDLSAEERFYSWDSDVYSLGYMFKNDLKLSHDIITKMLRESHFIRPRLEDVQSTLKGLLENQSTVIAGIQPDMNKAETPVVMQAPAAIRTPLSIDTPTTISDMTPLAAGAPKAKSKFSMYVTQTPAPMAQQQNQNTSSTMTQTTISKQAPALRLSPCVDIPASNPLLKLYQASRQPKKSPSLFTSVTPASTTSVVDVEPVAKSHTMIAG